MSSAAMAGLIGEFERAKVAIDPSVVDGGLAATTRQLNEIEFSVKSPCADVTVWYAASGLLREVIIADGALKRHDHRQMATLISKTLVTAEKIVMEAVREYARRQLQGATR